MLACSVLRVRKKELRLGCAVGVEQRVLYRLEASHYKWERLLLMLSAAYCEGSFILRIVVEGSSEAYDRGHRSVDCASVSEGHAAVSVDLKLCAECLGHLP